MKNKRLLARIAVGVIALVMFIPCLTVFAANDYSTPKGYVDPVKELHLTPDSGHMDITTALHWKYPNSGDADKQIEVYEFYMVPYGFYSQRLYFAISTSVKGAESVQDQLMDGVIKGIDTSPFVISSEPIDHNVTVEYSEHVVRAPGVETEGFEGDVYYKTEVLFKNLYYDRLYNKIMHNGGGYQNVYVTAGIENKYESMYNGRFDYTESVDFVANHTTLDASIPCKFIMSEDGSRLECFLYAIEETENEGDVAFSQCLMCYVTGIKYRNKDGTPVGDGGFMSFLFGTDAESTAGEAGYAVPAMIITGLVAAGVAIAVGASGKGDSGEASEDETVQSTYKMYIGKDFGNKIRYNRQGVQVNARMAEIKPEGTEVDRPDLTQSINITSGGNVDVEGGGLAGGYMCALVSCSGVSGADNPREGIVSFTFNGDGGTFTNNVTFELVGELRIDVNDELKMIYGDGKRYDIRIELVDFLAPAENITFNYGTSPVEAEAEKLDDSHYTLHIRNNSQKPEGTFFTTDSLRFEVTAQNGDESATEGIVGTLMPEGLSVKRRNDTVIEDERFALKCYENTDEEGEKDIPITRISFMIAIPETDENGATKVKCPVVTEDMFTFAPMTADDTRFANIANNAQCVFTMDKNASGSDSIVTYEIQPKRQIPQESGKKYDIILPVSCACEGNSYTLDVPVRVIGDKLQAEMQAKAKEIELLKVRIRRYLDPDEIAGFLAKYDTKVQDMSAYDIRLMSMSLVYMSQTEAYEARWQGLKANMLDWAQWGAEWVKWAGDQAFSMLINYYAGPQYGPILDSVLSPAKDIICEELGTCLDQWYSGKDVTGLNDKFEKYSQTVLVMIENCLSNSIDGKTDVKKAGLLLATYCALRFLNHVMFDDKGMYDAVLATFGDMTAQAFKFTAGMSLEKYIGNPSNKNKIGALVYKWIKNNMPEGMDGLSSDDVIRKYLEETVAMLGGKVSSEAVDVYNAANAGVIVIPIKFNVGNSDGESEAFRDFTVAIDPVASLEKLKDFLFEQLFSVFTFATSPMKMPNDAKYYSKA